jgi:hypothetical protein
MQITSTARFAKGVRLTKVDKNAQHEMCKLVTGNHDIAWSEEIDSKIQFEGSKQKFPLIEAPFLRTFSINNFNQVDKANLIRKEYLELSQKACELAQQCFPDMIDKPVNGINLLIASAQAYDLWTEKNDSYVVEGSLATGKAVLQAFDVFEHIFPVLQQYQTHKQVAGLLLKMVDSVYVIQKEYDSRLVYR